MNDHRNRQRLQQALDLVTQVSGEHQCALNDRAAATVSAGPGYVNVGQILALGRRVDALERIGRDLAELLDGFPPAAPLRPLPSQQPGQPEQAA
jgi:hypothetical protein